MTVIAATLLTDRKPAWPVALDYLLNEPLIEKVYVNIETNESDLAHYLPVIQALDVSDKPYDVDYWSVFHSTWMTTPRYDQDAARFMPIARGRNMALDWAIVQTMLNLDVSHLLFVDSDVRPHPRGLERLLALDKPLCGGLVPGRGAHSQARYVFGEKERNGPILRCDHGTSGYLLIHRSIFEVLRFRAGPCVYQREVFLCDDPAYATDAVHYGLADGWYIDTRATADHVDDPDHPLTLEGAINDYHGVPR